MAGQGKSPRLDELFRACDTQGKGYIGPEEFRELCKTYGISETEADMIFTDVDHDGDGQIDFEDFTYGFRDFLIPASRRGSLTVTEMDLKNWSARYFYKQPPLFVRSDAFRRLSDASWTEVRLTSESRSPETDKDSGQETLSGTRTPEVADYPLHPSKLLDVYAKLNQRKPHRNPFVREMQPERTFKVILAGDAAVGKSTFIERLCNGYFVSNLNSTIGMDFRVKTLEVDDKVVVLQLWDTAGQERFRSLAKSYFRRADGVILMYDVTNEQTFLSIRQWIQNVEEGAGRKVPIVLCGNKVDLRENLYKGVISISTEEGSKSAQRAFFMETSPKTGLNVTPTLMLLAKEMTLLEDAELQSLLKLEDENVAQVKKRSCCGRASRSEDVKKPNPSIS